MLFAELGHMLENLAFDGNGTLYATAFDAGLFSVLPDGNVTSVVASDRPQRPGDVAPATIRNAFMGVALTDSGALFVAEGHSLAGRVDGRVLHVDAENGSFAVFAEGFDNTNGMAAGPDGALYLAHGFAEELWRIEPDGSWAVWTTVPDVVNGVVVHPDGEHLVIAPLGDNSQTVYAIPFDDPDGRHALFRFGAAPGSQTSPAPGKPVHAKGIDDLAVTDDGRILVSAHLRHQFVLGDPATGSACILMSETEAEPSSIRVAKGFGDWDGWAFGSDFSGAIWAFDVRPPGVNGTEAADDPEPEGEEAAGAPGVGVAWSLVALAALVGLGRARR